ncbi:MAG: peptidase [Mycobacterium sp.]|nr:peptidase [Mycobacterium sp.]
MGAARNERGDSVSESEPGKAQSGTVRGEDEVVALCSELIRIDTSNYGDHSGPGERAAAEYMAEKLAEVGLEPRIFESHQGRASTVARIEGEDRSRPALLIHGHTDVVPANADDWAVHPFSGEIAEDCVWGRGAIDMKDMDAMTLAVVRDRLRTGRKPPRDIVLAFVADEEAGGTYGARYLVDKHPELFEGVTEAIGEVGGFSLTIPHRDGGDKRLYLIETAEKGMQWMRLTARGRAGHGSFVHDENAVTTLAGAVARLGGHRFPLVLTDPVAQFLTAVGEETGHAFDPDSPDLDGTIAKLGPIGRIVGATMRDSANPTMLKAGYKANVIPATAEAVVDCRVLPGRQAAFEATIDELIGPDVTREWITELPSYETTFDGELVDAMNAALLSADPQARIVPYMLSGGTDAKHFARLDIRCFGFIPLRLPPELDFAALFHGVDERVPVESLTFGTQVLEHFLLHC